MGQIPGFNNVADTGNTGFQGQAQANNLFGNPFQQANGQPMNFNPQGAFNGPNGNTGNQFNLTGGNGFQSGSATFGSSGISTPDFNNQTTAPQSGGGNNNPVVGGQSTNFAPTSAQVSANPSQYAGTSFDPSRQVIPLNMQPGNALNPNTPGYSDGSSNLGAPAKGPAVGPPPGSVPTSNPNIWISPGGGTWSAPGMAAGWAMPGSQDMAQAYGKTDVNGNTNPFFSDVTRLFAGGGSATGGQLTNQYSRYAIDPKTGQWTLGPNPATSTANTPPGPNQNLTKDANGNTVGFNMFPGGQPPPGTHAPTPPPTPPPSTQAQNPVSVLTSMMSDPSMNPILKQLLSGLLPMFNQQNLQSSTSGGTNGTPRGLIDAGQNQAPPPSTTPTSPTNQPYTFDGTQGYTNWDPWAFNNR